MNLPPVMAAEAALARQNVALSNLKNSADTAEFFAKTIEETIKSSPVPSLRGSNVNFSV